MKTIEIPQDLLKLPFPWNVPEDSCRRKYINVLDKNKRTFEEALVALERLLSFLSQQQEPEGKSIPEEMTEYWYFTVSSIASEIPTLEDFNLAKIEKKFRLSKIESPSEIMISEAAQKWIWTVARDTAGSILSWLREAMNNCQDIELSNRYLKLASQYWQSSIPHSIKINLINASNIIARKKAIPLIEEVERISQNPNLVRMARSYKKLTLKHYS